MAESLPALAGLFLASFAAATLIPLPSEAALFGFLKAYPDQLALAIAVATAGNTAGGMTTYWLGRLVPRKAQERMNPRTVSYLRRFGAGATFFAWLPVFGDALCGAAGWLRIRWWSVLGFMAAGRLARYVAAAFLAS
jgi:membrane protein YqaA with SNARE-associated domain